MANFRFEAVARIVGVVAGALAFLKYDLIVDYFVRFTGSGATYITIGVLVFIGFLAFVLLFLRFGTDATKASGRSGDGTAAEEPAEAFVRGSSVVPDAGRKSDPFHGGGALGQDS